MLVPCDWYQPRSSCPLPPTISVPRKAIRIPQRRPRHVAPATQQQQSILARCGRCIHPAQECQPQYQRTAISSCRHLPALQSHMGLAAEKSIAVHDVFSVDQIHICGLLELAHFGSRIKGWWGWGPRRLRQQRMIQRTHDQWEGGQVYSTFYCAVWHLERRCVVDKPT